MEEAGGCLLFLVVIGVAALVGSFLFDTTPEKGLNIMMIIGFVALFAFAYGSNHKD